MSEWFQVKVGVHQGSVLSPLLLATVIDDLTDDTVKTMIEVLYVDGLVLEDDWKDGREVRQMEKGITKQVVKSKC